VTYYVILPLTAENALSEVPRLATVLLLYVPYGLAMATSFLLWQRSRHARPPVPRRHPRPREAHS